VVTAINNPEAYELQKIITPKATIIIEKIIKEVLK
jgi:hypothetical protein